jgi:hypothetical protein
MAMPVRDEHASGGARQSPGKHIGREVVAGSSGVSQQQALPKGRAAAKRFRPLTG